MIGKKKFSEKYSTKQDMTEEEIIDFDRMQELIEMRLSAQYEDAVDKEEMDTLNILVDTHATR